MPDVDPKTLEAESLAWVNQLLSGAVTPGEAQAFRDWRKRSAAHEAAFQDAVRFRRQVRDAVLDGRYAPPAPRPVPSLFQPASRLGRAGRSAPGRSGGVSRRALIGGALAASGVGVVVAAGSGAHPWSGWLGRRPDYSTGVGQGRLVALNRDVTLQMNTRTRVVREGSQPGGAIRLLSGEAAITSLGPGARPFEVAAGVGRARLEATEVDVRLEGDRVCVTCLAGATEIVHPLGRVRLTTAEQVVYTDTRLEPARVVDAQLVSAWRRGQLIFRDAPLSQVVEELNRYRRGRIVLLDPALGRRPVDGVFQLRRIAGALDQVEALTGARAIHLPDGLVFLS